MKPKKEILLEQARNLAVPQTIEVPWFDARALDDTLKYSSVPPNALQSLIEKIVNGIAECLMLRLLDEGISCLPVHDSFIVQSKHSERLAELMISIPKELYGYKLYIKEK